MSTLPSDWPAPEHAQDIAQIAPRAMREIELRWLERWHQGGKAHFPYLRLSYFADPALRVTTARYWKPQSEIQRLMQIAWDDEVHVNVVIDQYTAGPPQVHETTMPFNELGRIFSIVHDMYWEIYTEQKLGDMYGQLHFGPLDWLFEGRHLSLKFVMNS